MSNSKKPKLTPKQTKFVQGIANGKQQREAYIEAYDTKGNIPTVDVEATRTLSKPQVKEALEQLFGMEETKQVVANLHKLAISAEDEKNQIEATKVWMDRAVPKTTDTGTTFNFVQVNQDMKDKYGIQ